MPVSSSFAITRTQRPCQAKCSSLLFLSSSFFLLKEISLFNLFKVLSLYIYKLLSLIALIVCEYLWKVLFLCSLKNKIYNKRINVNLESIEETVFSDNIFDASIYLFSLFRSLSAFFFFFFYVCACVEMPNTKNIQHKKYSRNEILSDSALFFLFNLWKCSVDQNKEIWCQWIYIYSNLFLQLVWTIVTIKNCAAAHWEEQRSTKQQQQKSRHRNQRKRNTNKADRPKTKQCRKVEPNPIFVRWCSFGVYAVFLWLCTIWPLGLFWLKVNFMRQNSKPLSKSNSIYCNICDVWYVN